MKLVIAYVQPFVADRVIDALHSIPGVSGATVMEARGFGRGHTVEQPTQETVFGLAERLRLEVAIADELEEVVVERIATAARTGQRGDGKIIVLPITSAKRVATGETGPDVL